MLRWASAVAIGVLLVFIETCGNRIPQFAGPYTVVFRKVNNETDEYHSKGLIWGRLHSTPHKPKQKQHIWGLVNIGSELTNAMKIEVRLSVRSNNQWKRNAFVVKLDRACDNAFVHGKDIVTLVHGENAKCPLPKLGLKRIENQTLTLTFPKVPVFPYGHYLYTMAMIDMNEVIGVAVFEMDMIPKL